MRGLVLGCALALVATQALAAPARWIGSWAASPAPPAAAGTASRIPTPSFNNQTLAEIVRLSAGGQRLRVRFTNEYGARPLAIGAARVALVGPDGGILPGSDRPLAFAGAPSAVIPAGAPLLSDAVALRTKPLAKVRISLYLPDETGPCTCHYDGREPIAVSPPGDFTAKPIPPTEKPPAYRAFLSGVEVEGSGPPGPVVVAFGDSITDGAASTPGTDHRWPDRLAERLAAARPGRTAAVNNAGIGGNRILSDGLISAFGQSALTRFDRDVLSIPGATHVIVLEGVNDLGMASATATPTADALIAGYRQIIARARSHGLKVIGATILPYGGANYFRPAGEAVRQQVNAWIRTGGGFDGVVDLDAAMRDPARPERLRAELQSGDWLHPNDAGYRAMGEAFDLSLFR